MITLNFLKDYSLIQQKSVDKFQLDFYRLRLIGSITLSIRRAFFQRASLADYPAWTPKYAKVFDTRLAFPMQSRFC